MGTNALHLKDVRVSRVVAIVSLHLMALCAILWTIVCYVAFGTFDWAALVVAMSLYFVRACLGITLCYHRLLTHRSFKTYKWVEYVLIICASLAWQGGPIKWVGTHRIHHIESDTDDDPHTPKHGFSWAHVLWTLFSGGNENLIKQHTRDLQEDSFIRNFERWFWVPQIILAALLYAVGELWGHQVGTSGLALVLWGVGVSTVAVYHATWFVNSASHTWGYRNFDTKDNSRNNWWVAILAFGEGWHNNHHGKQYSAQHGMRWFEFDMTYRIIKLLELVGLAWDLKIYTFDKTTET